MEELVKLGAHTFLRIGNSGGLAPDLELGDHVSDAMARRVWWIDDYISTNEDLIYTLPGTKSNNP